MDSNFGSSNAKDFQPTTRNPQNIGGNSLQTPTSNLQPTNQSNGLSGPELLQQLNTVPNLRVETAQSTVGTISAPSTVAATNNNSYIGPLIGLVTSLIIVAAIMVWALRQRSSRTIDAHEEALPPPELEPEPTPQLDTPEQQAAVVAKPSLKPKSAASKKKKSANGKRKKK
jgi:hypothetical protein